MSGVFSTWVHSNCIICNGKILVPDSLVYDMHANTCINCAPESRSRADYDDDLIRPRYKPKCECGAVKAGDPYHARWCPVYVDPMAPKHKD